MASLATMPPPSLPSQTRNASLVAFLSDPANHPLPLNTNKAYKLIPVHPPTPLETFEDRQDRHRSIYEMRWAIWGNPRNRTKVDALPELEMQLIDLRLPTFRYVGRRIGTHDKARYFREREIAEVMEIEVDDWEVRVLERKIAEVRDQIERTRSEEVRRERSAHATASDGAPLRRSRRSRRGDPNAMSASSPMRAWEARLKATAEAAAEAEVAEAVNEASAQDMHPEMNEVTDAVIEACVRTQADEDDDWERGVYQETTEAEMEIDTDVTIIGEQGTPDVELDERHLAAMAQEALDEVEMFSKPCQEGW